MRIGELVDKARALADGRETDSAGSGFRRLTGGMSHDVFELVEDPGRVVKVFRAVGDEPEREWDALVALSGSGVAPEPVHFEAGDLPVVVMTRVGGSSRLAEELGAEHARAIGDVHRRVHRTIPLRPRQQSHAGIRALSTALMVDRPRKWAETAGEDELVARAWRAASRWIATADVELILSGGAPCFSRGDPNLTNYLWGDEGVVLVDWENSGYSSPALELADMAEHASSRALGDAFWDQVADATDLTPADQARVREGRRLMACFWLVLIEACQREGRVTTVTLDEQATRTIAVLDG